jgi:hypothetical protein
MAHAGCRPYTGKRDVRRGSRPAKPIRLIREEMLEAGRTRSSGMAAAEGPHTESFMETKGPLIPQQHRIPLVHGGADSQSGGPGTLATRDREVIRQWADRRQALPATGEQTSSGPKTTVEVNDGGAGIRFNFPGVSPFRGISWSEWFDHFERQDLTFVYEESEAGSTPSNRYRLVKASEWQSQFDAGGTGDR